MATATRTQIETFSGIAKQYSNGWWAMCDQLPIAAHGSSHSEALQSLLATIHGYTGMLNGSGRPKIEALRREGNSIPFEFSLAVE